jgi:ABC-type glycerol-3-phosphate transport system substrate-binding protein
MKRAATIKSTDVILSVGTLALVLLAMAAAVEAAGSTEEFTTWAWERHHNVLSWYIRPLFLLPFC